MDHHVNYNLVKLYIICPHNHHPWTEFQKLWKFSGGRVSKLKQIVTLFQGKYEFLRNKASDLSWYVLKSLLTFNW